MSVAPPGSVPFKAPVTVPVVGSGVPTVGETVGAALVVAAVAASVVAVSEVVWGAATVEVVWVVAPTWRRAAARNTHANGDSVDPFWEPNSDDKAGATTFSMRVPIDGVVLVGC